MFTALELTRSFHQAGHRVFVADSNRVNLCTVSNSVTRSLVLPSPRFQFEAFQEQLKKIIKEYQIDLVIPVLEETLWVAKARPNLPENCQLFCPDLSVLKQLHNKWLFYQLQKELDISTIPTRQIKNAEDLKKLDLPAPYVLKPSYSRGSFQLKKVSSKDSLPNLPFDSNNPWIAQAWIEGPKYCSYTICRNGRIQAHTVYPNNVAGDGVYCLHFEALKHPKIFQWIENIVRKLNLTGQISFDFIEDQEGRLFAIECNPRSTSGMHLIAESASMPNYFLEDGDEVFQPSSEAGKKYGFGMMLYGWKQRETEQSFWGFVKKFFSLKDVVFCKKDLWPFLLQIFIFSSALYYKLKYKLPIPAAFLNDLNWEGEEEG